MSGTTDSGLRGDELLARVAEVADGSSGNGWRRLLSACGREIERLREELAEVTKDRDRWRREFAVLFAAHDTTTPEERWEMVKREWGEVLKRLDG